MCVSVYVCQRERERERERKREKFVSVCKKDGDKDLTRVCVCE